MTYNVFSGTLNPTHSFGVSGNITAWNPFTALNSLHKLINWVHRVA